MNNQFEHMQKLAFGKVLINESKMTKKELKNKIREMILDEAKKKKKDEEEPADVAPQEDVDITASAEEAPMDTMTPTAPDAADIDPTVKNVQDLLQKAFVGAKQLGDEKLINQIGNTLTMLVRTQVLGAQQAVAEDLNEENWRGKENKLLTHIASKLEDINEANWETTAKGLLADLKTAGY